MSQWITEIQEIREELVASSLAGFEDCIGAKQLLGESLRDRDFSSLVTGQITPRLLRIPGVSLWKPPAAVFALETGSGQIRFRFNRSRLRRGVTMDNYSVEDLLGPTLNRISKATDVRLLVQWVSEQDERLDLWVCEPKAMLRAQARTQRAQFPRVDGRRWAAGVRLAQLQPTLAERFGERGIEPISADVKLQPIPTEKTGSE